MNLPMVVQEVTESITFIYNISTVSLDERMLNIQRTIPLSVF